MGSVRLLAKGLGIVLSALIVTGCASRAGWQYTPNPAQPARVQVPVTVAVTHFKDERGTTNTQYYAVCLIPLVPYCTASYERPENANGFLTMGAYNFRPSDDLAEAAATELRQTGMFKDVFVTNRAQDPGAQLELRGTILSTNWDASRYSYMLGPYSSVLWILGLPLGSAQNKLELHLVLVATSSGQQLWTTDISQDYSTTEGFYYDFATDFGYPQMFRTGMEPAVASLEAYVAQQPPGFWQHLGSDTASATPANR
ncbi:MAG TPA: hypothetical protein VMA09_05820 [Candidatus Binataceae bacterium]|nr:hypothetical protein [Candidatus Binataceae bacterium]